MTTSSKYLQWAVIGGLFLLPFLPLVVIDTMFFPFITGKNFAFRIIVEIIFACWLALVLITPQYRPKKSWILWAVVALVAVSTLATAFGINPYRSFWSNYERMEGLVTHLHLLALFLILISTLATEKLWNAFFYTSLGVSVIVTFYSFLQLAGKITINQGGVRVDGTFGNASYLAVYIMFHIFLAALYLFKRSSPAWLKWLLGVLMVLGSIILYHTATRGTILGFIGGIFLTAFLVGFLSRGSVRKYSLIVLVAVLILVGGFWTMRGNSFVQNSPVLNRFATISSSDRTTQSRFIIWGMGFKGFKERPILGWGPDNYNMMFNKYYDARLWPQESWFDRSHNIIFDWLISTGIIGLLTYLSIFFFALYYLWKKTTLALISKSIITGLLTGYLFQNMFIFDNIVSYILFFSVLAYTHFNVVKDKPPTATHRVVGQGTVWAVTTLVTVAMIFVLYFVNVKPILANRTIIQALSNHQQEGGLSENFKYFQKATSYNTFGISEAREQLAQVATGIETSDKFDQQSKGIFFTLARDEMQKQVYRFPNDARYQLFMSTLLDRGGLYADALPYLQKALELSPHKQAIMFELGAVYMGLKSYDKAFEILNSAYLLDKSNPEALNMLTKAHISLAVDYLSSGRRADSISELERAIELNPAFKDQGDYYINQIKAGKNP